ncbi:DUF192 domain-containing protein [Methanocella conradii]|uniref:DUF192 domain-containing protein n=1 Tax=Methanocella conradii TaxID=1175444 RepID=UPI0024B32594|nr:DUF192 domain-containing protein [Methanocella conradii]MDI6896471.1 DUF192 domain-containing protein [Methanocella conradii]
MKAGSIILLLLIMLALPFLCYLNLHTNDGTRVEFVNASGVVTTIPVEVADTPEEQEKGLMYRTHMDDDEGMLFIFSEDATRHFWMKDTPIPLDMVFVNSDYRIVDINYNATPKSEDVYTSKAICRYVIEVNGGFCREHCIGVGDQAKIYRPFSF